jgi:hypothetical protein
MFQAKSPDLSPGIAEIRTNNQPTTTKSPYEQKIVVTRLTTPELVEMTPMPTMAKTTLTLAHTLLPTVSQTPVPTMPTLTYSGPTALVPHRIPTPFV